MSFKTDQENFWASDFGKNYIDRNKGKKLMASNLNFFTRVLKNTHGIKTCIEFGANIGMNIKALKLLYPEQKHSAIEINSEAIKDLQEVIPKENIFEGSILDYNSKKVFDLTLIKGVLIHINPEELNNVYKKLVSSCDKYMLIAEYYNPSPISIPYRGHLDKLFKRDFCGEIMSRYSYMKLIDYGFVYKKDPNFPQDDITWFLMEKK